MTWSRTVTISKSAQLQLFIQPCPAKPWGWSPHDPSIQSFLDVTDGCCPVLSSFTCTHPCTQLRAHHNLQFFFPQGCSSLSRLHSCMMVSAWGAELYTSVHCSSWGFVCPVFQVIKVLDWSSAIHCSSKFSAPKFGFILCHHSIAQKPVVITVLGVFLP